MKNSYGIKWSEKEIAREIKNVICALVVERMPTDSEVIAVTKSHALSNAISKTGGYYYWAEKLGLATKKSETNYSREYEIKCKEFIESLGYKVEMTPVRFPYDLLVNDFVKVEVKASKLYKGKNGNFYSFNLEYKQPKSEINVFYCEGDDVTRIYVMPSHALVGINQLSIGEITSKYDVYLGRWDILKNYIAAVESFVKIHDLTR